MKMCFQHHVVPNLYVSSVEQKMYLKQCWKTEAPIDFQVGYLLQSVLSTVWFPKFFKISSFVKSSQVTFIYIALFTIQIVSKQLYKKCVSTLQF